MGTVQELGKLFQVSHEKVSQLMKQLAELKGRASTIPKLQAEVSSLQDSLNRAEQRLADAQAQQSDVRATNFPAHCWSGGVAHVGSGEVQNTCRHGQQRQVRPGIS